MIKKYFIILLILLAYTSFAQNKKNRIQFNNQEIFLNGANIAWEIFNEPDGMSNEFHPKTTFGVNEVQLYEELYKRGYAGAQAWSWTDSNHEKMLLNMKDVSTKHQKDVEIIK